MEITGKGHYLSTSLFVFDANPSLTMGLSKAFDANRRNMNNSLIFKFLNFNELQTKRSI